MMMQYFGRQHCGEAGRRSSRRDRFFEWASPPHSPGASVIGRVLLEVCVDPCHLAG
jgi:hypothetical protein